MKSIGFCIGSSNISMVELEENHKNYKIVKAQSIPHDGNAKGVIKSIFDEYDLYNYPNIAITGRKSKSFINLSSISEPEAVEYAYSFLCKKYNYPNVIVSAGGETFAIYEIDKNGRIINVVTGNKCASGTGEFFLQQIKRMNIDIEAACEIAQIDNPHKVSGRCSVFCKSDCTHALNKGEHKGKVIAGLCEMMANKIIELLKKINYEKVLLIGGTAKNRIMVNYLKRDIEELIVADEADYFEALGVSIWAACNNTAVINQPNDLFNKSKSSFNFLEPLSNYQHKVIFKDIKKDKPNTGDTCIIGLDVGSTTTKAILLREQDNAILADVYLRTNGDPVSAARQCYKKLEEQVDTEINIIGMGVTGSGRQIAGLHGLTDGIINEIIAHATAAVYFDKDVDTIFEIGGQDAKYTYITNKVPCDYAMNEACSAGTGSFLEESARETMGIKTEDIQDIALSGTSPPNFNDQCAAFISSDIKNAVQEGISKEDIIAGLVYSICQNYSNRVKGNRKVGKKVFMQGGVCYNKAVPIAMAGFTGKDIVVPPEPGLMGAFGVALELKNRINLGLIKPKKYDLHELSIREVNYNNSFICSGGKEKCDRRCNINMIEINGSNYPFGGVCNKYVNLVRNVEYDNPNLDLVLLREKLIFEKYSPFGHNNPNGKKIGISKSLLTNTLYPLYYNFFTKLGFNVVLGDTPLQKGIDKKGAPFCYPVELSHGFMEGLLQNELDYIFIPQVMGMYVENGIEASVVCPLAQGEPYYLKATFSKLKNFKVLSPVLNFSHGYNSLTSEFIKIGEQLGMSNKLSEEAYKYAYDIQFKMLQEMQEIGKNVLDDINKNNKIGIVLFGRPYNAFTKDANMGIPHKFSSRGYYIIPFDFLPYNNEEAIQKMYWSIGQSILKCAKYVAKHQKLFGTFITNFSCGPDSFLINYFRNIMKDKPSLTLELDSHTADAGIDTRIEAFLDIVNSYLNINNTQRVDTEQFNMSKVEAENNLYYLIDSNNNKHLLTDPKVKLLIPSMGNIGSRCMAASFRYAGINAASLNPYTDNDYRVGREHATCKECLPLMLTVGGLLNYIKNKEDKDQLIAYFMPQTCGPCRFGQYNVLMENIIKSNSLKNVALLSLNSENGYEGFEIKFKLRAWRSIIITDILQQIYNSIIVLAVNKESALKIYNQVCDDIIESIARDSWSDLKVALKNSADTLSKIPVKYPLKNAKKVGLVGEIFVRHDFYSSQNLVNKLAQKDIVVKIASMEEWLYYCDYRIKKDISHLKKDFWEKVNVNIQGAFKITEERKIKKIMAKSGLYEFEMVEVDRIIDNVKDLISPSLTGEAILTTGLAITEIIDNVHGVISLGPFGCMPSRIAESVISHSLNTHKREISDSSVVKLIMKKYPSLPFLSIETDGNVFPPTIEAKLETFCLQVDRIYNDMKSYTS